MVFVLKNGSESFENSVEIPLYRGKHSDSTFLTSLHSSFYGLFTGDPVDYLFDEQAVNDLLVEFCLN